MKFKVLIGIYKGQIGELVGEIDFRGGGMGWHTLKMPNGKNILVTGDEVEKTLFEEPYE